MRRFVITIVLNGLRHLLHRNQAQRLLRWADYWSVAEGAANNQGSTGWCRPALPQYHAAGRSIDGTCEYLHQQRQACARLLLAAPPTRCWHSKERFEHYAYYFEQDVRFKAAWYGGHERVLAGWHRIQQAPAGRYPIPWLFPDGVPLGQPEQTQIEVLAPANLAEPPGSTAAGDFV